MHFVWLGLIGNQRSGYKLWLTLTHHITLPPVDCTLGGNWFSTCLSGSILESMSTISYGNIYFQNLIYIELGGILFGKHCFRRNALLLIALGSPFLWNLFGRVFLKADISYFWRNRISLLINIFPITFQNFEMSYHTFCQWVYFAPCTLLIKAAIYEKLRIIVKVNKHPTLE